MELSIVITNGNQFYHQNTHLECFRLYRGRYQWPQNRICKYVRQKTLQKPKKLCSSFVASIGERLSLLSELNSCLFFVVDIQGVFDGLEISDHPIPAINKVLFDLDKKLRKVEADLTEYRDSLRMDSDFYL